MRKTIFLALFSLILASQAGFAATVSNHAKKTKKSTTVTTTTQTKSHTAAHTSPPKTASHTSKTTTTKASSPTKHAKAKSTTATSQHVTTTHTTSKISSHGKNHYTSKYHTSKHIAKSRVPQGDVEAMAGSESEALATPDLSSTNNPVSDSSLTHRMVALVDQTVQNLRYSVYKLGGTHYDASKGVYMVDCSDYVDHLLHDSSPHAYSSLANWSGSYRPNTEHYYDFFTQRLAAADDPNWKKIDNSQKLEPGDILVFRYKNPRGKVAGGHIMVVMDKPSGSDDVLQLRVADSAASGHSEDTRPAHTSGIGIGTMLLKVDTSTGQPYAYAWKAGAPWKSNVNFAMARPTNSAA